MRQGVTILITFISLFLSTSYSHARLDISPSSIYFFQTQIGFWDVRSVTVRNTGVQEQRVNVTNGSCFMDFEVRDNCFGTLRQYQSCNIDVWFRPRYEGYADCSFNVNGTTSFQSVNVSGYGYKR